MRSATQTVSVTNLGTTASRGSARRARETILMQTTGTALLVVSRRCAGLAGVAYLLTWVEVAGFEPAASSSRTAQTFE
jgi:hypothetical protein